jgi:hypothetical protein
MFMPVNHKRNSRTNAKNSFFFQKRQTSMLTVGFEPAILETERPQTFALDRAATGTGNEFPVGL